MQGYRQLRVWHLGHAFLLDVYRVTAKLPGDERYGLTSQLRRAALSVPTNIVEGSRRQGRQDYARFLNLAEASLVESYYLLGVCVDLEYLPPELIKPLHRCAERLIRRLRLLRARVEVDGHGRSGIAPPRGTRSEAACLARSTRPVETSIADDENISPPDASAQRDALNASGGSRDALNASAEREALNVSRASGEPPASGCTARSTTRTSR